MTSNGTVDLLFRSGVVDGGMSEAWMVFIRLYKIRVVTMRDCIVVRLRS